MAIFWVLCLLMAAVDIKQLLFSEGKGTVCEKERREEILQKLKKQDKSLQLLSSHLKKKEIANLEGGQGPVAKSALALDTKIQQWICKVLFLAAIMLFKFWA